MPKRKSSAAAAAGTIPETLAAAAAAQPDPSHPDDQPDQQQPEQPDQPEQLEQPEQQQPPAATPPAAAEQDDQQKPASSKPAKKHKKLLSEQKLRRLKEQHDKRGIIYVSRLPPHMKPGKLRQMLAQYGEIGRIYCTPEDSAARKQRKRKGGNSGKNFTEGWVEFEDKAVAKQVAAGLNGQQMGGKRRSAYHFDLWALKYLPKFKWDHLTEEISYEKAVREQRMAHELSAAKRERDFYLSRVDRAKAIAAMDKRQQAKQQQQQQQADGQQGQQQLEAAGGSSGGAAGDAAGGKAAAAAAAGVKRVYGQRKAKPDPSQPGSEVGDDVLGLILARKPKKQRVGE